MPLLYLPFACDAAGRHGEAGAFSPPGSRPPGMAGPVRGSLTRHEKGALTTRGSLTRRAKGQAVRTRRRYPNLERANLERANLERANLERANLERDVKKAGPSSPTSSPCPERNLMKGFKF